MSQFSLTECFSPSVLIYQPKNSNPSDASDNIVPEGTYVARLMVNFVKEI